jgi:hypothetical protein
VQHPDRQTGVGGAGVAAHDGDGTPATPAPGTRPPRRADSAGTRGKVSGPPTTVVPTRRRRRGRAVEPVAASPGQHPEGVRHGP